MAEEKHDKFDGARVQGRSIPVLADHNKLWGWLDNSIVSYTNWERNTATKSPLDFNDYDVAFLHNHGPQRGAAQCSQARTSSQRAHLT